MDERGELKHSGYSLSITRDFNRQIPHGNTIDDYHITANIDSFPDRPESGEERFYVLMVKTLKKFDETIAFLRGVGLTDRAMIWRLRYGKNLIESLDHDGTECGSRVIYSVGNPDEKTEERDSVFTMGDLNPELIFSVEGCDGDIFMRARGESGTPLENVALFYDRDEVKGPFDTIKTIRRVAMMDTAVVEPRFSQLLGAAPFELNPKEVEMLKTYISQALLL
jgi:hypothetical protein